MMAEIDIQFSDEMAEAALNGQKICTTRSERKGEIGDTFQILGAKFILIDIWPATWITYVRDDLYRLEGCESPEEFERIWRALHRGRFKTNKDYVIHFFGRIA
jgi:hypothetical protein